MFLGSPAIVPAASAPELNLRQLELLLLPLERRLRSDQLRAPHRAGDGATHQAVQPVVVAPLGTLFPFVDRSAAAFGLQQPIHVFRFAAVGAEQSVIAKNPQVA
ncbi:MAG: hypothetical protein RIC55_09380 [Pirellulaceae bacterium]